MTVLHWNTLTGEMRTYDFSAYDGVMILHGTALREYLECNINNEHLTTLPD